MDRRMLFYLLKISTLIHDVVWKPWIVTRSFEREGKRIGRVITGLKGSPPADEFVEECKHLIKYIDLQSGEIHEHEAYALSILLREKGVIGLDELFKKYLLRIDIGRIIKDADAIATSFDRWLLMAVSYTHLTLPTN